MHCNTPTHTQRFQAKCPIDERQQLVEPGPVQLSAGYRLPYGRTQRCLGRGYGDMMVESRGGAMSDPLTAIEVEVAKEIVKALMGGLVDLVRKVPALFRRSGKVKEELVAAELDRSAAQLAAAGGDGLVREQVRQEAAWEVLLRGLLAEHPDAAPELRAIAAEIQRSAPTVYQQRVDGGSAGAQGPSASATVHHHYYGDRQP